MVIDRSFVTADGVRWIIDYKTSSHQGAGAEEFLRIEADRYQSQLQKYRRAVTAMGFTAQPIRTALYYPLLSRLVEVPTAA